MGIEIERKFLVIGSHWHSVSSTTIVQGYLSLDPERTVRIRIAGDDAFLTIKGLSDGPSRAEYEYPIPVADALEMITLCIGGIISKTRHWVEVGSMDWEIDVFHGANDGLVVAEVELESADQLFEVPVWLGPEVTHDARYFNSSLMQHPFSAW